MKNTVNTIKFLQNIIRKDQGVSAMRDGLGP